MRLISWCCRRRGARVGRRVSVRASLCRGGALAVASTPWPLFTNAAGKPRIALNLVETALGRAGLKADTTIVEARAVHGRAHERPLRRQRRGLEGCRAREGARVLAAVPWRTGWS